MANYTKCGDREAEMVRSLVRRWHSHLQEAEVTFDLLFALGKDGEPALKAPGGWPALGKVKINSLRERVAGLHDVTIFLDGDKWDDLEPEVQRAILDHELEHLEVSRGDTGNIKRDDCGRPRLSVKQHDFQLGGFDVIVDRHGKHAVEAQAVKAVCEREVVQRLFSFMGATA